MSDAVGALYLDVLTDEAQLRALEKRLEATSQRLERALALKNDPFAPLFDGVSKSAPQAERSLTALEKAARSLAAAQKVVTAEQKAGLLTQDQAVAKLKALSGQYTATYKAAAATERGYDSLADALAVTATATGKLEQAQVKARAAFDANRVREYRDAQNFLRTELERGALEMGEFVAKTQALQTEMVGSRGDFAALSKEVGALDRVIGTTARGLQTAEGRFSKLGLSQQVAIGNSRKLGDSFNGLQGAIGPLLGGVGMVGLLNVTADLAKQADTTRVSQEVLAATIKRTGQDAGAVQEAISNTADALKLTDAQVADSAATLLRLGLNAEQIEAGLTSAGASALAFGTTSSQGIESFTSALATGNSQALNTIGIAENIGAVMNEAADAHGGAATEAGKQASATAGLQVVLDATASEVELLDTLTGGLAGKQADANKAAFEAKQAFGEMLIPLETLKNEVLAGVLGQFSEMPDQMQASVLSIGGVTAGVTVLTGGMVALRAAMLPLFAPPAGLLIAGVAAVAALGTGIYQLSEQQREAADSSQIYADTVRTGVTALSEASDVDGLITSLETVGRNLEGPAKTAWETYTQEVKDSKTEIDDVGEKSKEAIAELLTVATLGPKSAIEAANSALRTTVAGLVGLTDAQADQITRAMSRGPEALAQTVAELRTQIASANEVDLDDPFANYDRSAPEALAALQSVENALEPVMGAQRELAEAQAERDALLRELAGVEAAAAEATTATGDAADGAASSTDALNAAVGDTPTVYTDLTGAVAEATDSLVTYNTEARNVVTPAVVASTVWLEQAAYIRSLIEASRDLAEQERVTGGDILANAQAAETAALAQTTWRLSVDGTRAGLSEMRSSVIESEEAQRLLNVAQLDGIETTSGYLSGIVSYSKAQADAYNSNESLRESYDLLAGGTVLLGSELTATGEVVTSTAGALDDLADVSGSVELPQPEVSADFKDYVHAFEVQLPKAFGTAKRTAALFGEDVSDTEIMMGLLQAEMESLIEKGLDPQDERLQSLSERYLTLAGNLKENEAQAEQNEKAFESLAEVQSGLADAGSLSNDELYELRLTLTELAESTTTAADEARDLLPELEALEQARAVGDEFAFLGDMAQLALDSIPGLSTEATAGLSGLAAAGSTAADVLADGFNGMGDVLSILDAGVQAVASTLGDDVPAEVNVAADAVSGAFSGAAAGATFGPWGAVAGGIIGGLIGLFGGIAEEQAKIAEEQAAFNEQLKETDDLLRDISEQNDQGRKDSETDVLESKLEYAESSGDYKGKRGEGQLALAQLQIDLLEANDAYDAAKADLDERRTALITESQSISDQLVSGIGEDGQRLTAAMRADLQERQEAIGTELANTQTEADNLQKAYGYEIGTLLEGSNEIAKQLGISQSELYEALLTGNTEILGQLSEEQLGQLREGIVAYYKVFGEFPPGMEGVAAELGYSFDPVSGAIVDGSGRVVTALGEGSTTTRAAVDGLIGQLTQMFGPEAQPIIDAINALYTEQSAALTTGDQQLATTAAGSDAGRAAVDGLITELQTLFGDRAGPIIDLINQTYADMGTAVSTGGTTLSTQATDSATLTRPAVEGTFTAVGDAALAGSALSTTALQNAFTALSGELGTQSSTLSAAQGTVKTTLSGNFAELFGGLTGAVDAALPGVRSALSGAFGDLEALTGDDGAALAREQQTQEKLLALRQKELFLQQQVAAGRYGPEAAAELKRQLEAERAALVGALNGPGGLLGSLQTGTTSVSEALESFFGRQRSTITTQASSTVGTINGATRDVQGAINKLMSATGTGRSASADGRSWAAGGGSGRGAVGLFAPLSMMVDERALGGMGDGFGGFDTFSLASEIEQRPFGLGFAMPVSEPDRGGGFAPVRRAGALAGLLSDLRRDVEGYKRGVVSSVSSAITTTREAFTALVRSVGSVKVSTKVPDGFVRAEDGSLVPKTFYDMVRAEDGSWVPKSFYSKNRVPPGFVRAEDGSLVPKSFYGLVQAEDGSWVPKSFYNKVQTETEAVLNALEEADRRQDAYLRRHGKKRVRANDEQKKAYAEHKAELMAFERDTFELISGRALTGYNIVGRKDGVLSGLLGGELGGHVQLLTGFTEAQQEVLDFAKTTGLALEQSVSGGIKSGLQDALKSGEALSFQSTLEGLFDTTFDGLFDQLSKQVLAQQLGPLLTDLTADITKGDARGATSTASQIAARLPGVMAQLERSLAPLRGLYGSLGVGEREAERAGSTITLQQRSIGGATPEWVNTLDRVAQLQLQYAARMEGVVGRFESLTSPNSSLERALKGRTRL